MAFKMGTIASIIRYQNKMRKEPLIDIAVQTWKDAPSMQEKWIDAINWLRQHSSKGWILDKQVSKTGVIYEYRV